MDLAKPAYDACGSLLSDAKGQTYKWDGLGRLVGAKDRTGAQLGTYLYDANNRRVRKTYPNGSGGLKTTDYIYDGWQVLEEREGGAVVRRYVYGREMDEPVMMEVITGATAIRYFYHQDLNHNVAGLTDIYGNLVESYYYDPYGVHVRVLPGNQRAAEASSTVGNPYLFAGRTFDSETGLYYNRNRFYDPHVGRFISRDPIRFSGGVNLYNYANCNPINFMDPMGLETWGQKASRDLQQHIGLTWLTNYAVDLGVGGHQYLGGALYIAVSAGNGITGIGNLGTSVGNWWGGGYDTEYDYKRDGTLVGLEAAFDGAAIGLTGASAMRGGSAASLPENVARSAENALVEGIGREIDLGQETISVCPEGSARSSFISEPETVDPFRRTPNNLNEQLTMEEAQSGGGMGEYTNLEDKLPLGDPRYQGWDKWQYLRDKLEAYNPETNEFELQKVNIHYVRDPVTGATSDFKFK